jgi:hypothetical protein
MLSLMAVARAVVIAFPRWRIVRHAGHDVFAMFAELDALERAQMRLMWMCFALTLCALGSLEALALTLT